MPRTATHHRPLLALILALLAAGAGGELLRAQAPDEAEPDPPATFLEALQEGEFHLGLRYRFEQADDDAFADTARASTLRTTLGYRTATWRGWSLFLEAEDLSPVFDDDRYNNAGADGRGNGVRGLPVVADPEGTAMNQGYVRWSDGTTQVTLGRQEINLGDQRFVGAVGWRQHHQSFDAARVESKVGPVAVDYSYASAVNRIFGDRLQMGSHFLQLGVEPAPAHRVTGYGFYLDYDDPSPLSTSTLGIEAAGLWKLSTALSLRYELEGARQEDAGNNPQSVDTDYRLATIGADVGEFGFDVTWEVLGGPGDGQRPFSTPLATLHKFNGWADRFLQTPADGLETLYLRARGPLGERFRWTLVYHDFGADEGNQDFGTEIDGELLYRSSWGQSFGLKVARFAADGAGADTRKIMLWSSYGF